MGVNLLEMRRRLMYDRRSFPPGYQRMDYLMSASSGNAFIDTIDTVHKGAVITLKFNAPSASVPVIYGWRHSQNESNTGYNVMLITNGSSYRRLVAGVPFGSTGVDFAFNYDEYTTIVLDTNADKITVNGSEVPNLQYNLSEGGVFNSSGSSGVAPVIFAMRDYNGNTSNYAHDTKVYGYTVQMNGEKLMNLIPCIRLSDSEAGMYDTVGKRFLTNAGNSGSFTAH